MVAYSSNEIVNIILVLGEAGWNYCRAERLYHNRYPFKRHPNTMQIRKILLRKRRKICKRNQANKCWRWQWWSACINSASNDKLESSYLD